MIRQKYLLALEEEDWPALPAATYVKGFIRSYANYLDLPAEDLISLYQAERSRDDQAIPARPIGTLPRASGWLKLGWLMSVATAVAGALLLFYFYRQYQSYVRSAGPVPAPTELPIAATLPTPVLPPSPTPTPLPSPMPTATPHPGSGVEVKLAVVRPAWLRVEVDGREVFQGTLRAGTERTFKGQDAVSILSGNAGGVSVTVNGQSAGLMGAEGQVVEKEWRAKR